MAKPVIVLDPGHGVNANKGIVPGYWESNGNLAACRVLKEELEAYGFTVHMTKADGSNPSLDARGKLAVTKKADVFLSWHSDAAADHAARGATVYLSAKTPGGKPLAEKLVKAIADTMGTRNRGVTTRWNGGRDYYGVLAASTGYAAHKPAVSMLVEHGFHTNQQDCEYLDSGARRAELVRAEAAVLAAHFGLVKGGGTPAPSPAPQPGGKLYRVQLGAFKVAANATALRAKLKKAGYEAIVVTSGGLHRVQVGAFGVKANAEALRAKLKKAGCEAIIV